MRWLSAVTSLHWVVHPIDMLWGPLAPAAGRKAKFGVKCALQALGAGPRSNFGFNIKIKSSFSKSSLWLFLC